MLALAALIAAFVRPAAARTCTTCRGPVHSWAKVPVSFHSSSSGTGPTGEFPDWYLDTLKKFPLITSVPPSDSFMASTRSSV